MTQHPSALILGIGVVTPAGVGKSEFWNGLASGMSFAELLEWPDLKLRAIGCRVNDDDVLASLTTPERRRLDRIAHLSLAAATEATDEARYVASRVAPERRGIIVGIGFGGIATLTSQQRLLHDRGPRAVSPFGLPAAIPSAVAGTLSIRFGVTGPVTTVSSACASGTQALGEAYRLVRGGFADLVIAGGAEAPLDPLPISAFDRMDALSRRFHDPLGASRPFDRDRDGFVIGEGAAFFIIGNEDAASQLGGPVHGELVGYALTNDASHITAPDASGNNATRCITMALADAGVHMGDLSHVNTHGTSTRLNDTAEAAALLRCQGSARYPPALALKGAIGHLMGAAGAVEVAASLLACRHRWLPPTVNFRNADDGVEIDVSSQGRPISPDAPFLSLSFGFGGQNAALVVRPGPAR